MPAVSTNRRRLAALTGSSANTFTGTTTVDGGTLNLGKNAPGNGRGDCWQRRDQLRRAPVTYAADNQINDASTITINGGLLDLASSSDSITGLTLNNAAVKGSSAYGFGLSTGQGQVAAVAGSSQIQSNWSLWRNESVDVASGEVLNVSGVVQNFSTNIGAITRTRAGTLILSGASNNTLTGNSIVAAGTLVLAKAQGISRRAAERDRFPRSDTSDRGHRPVTDSGFITLNQSTLAFDNAFDWVASLT